MRSASILQLAAGVFLAAFSFALQAATPITCPAGQNHKFHVTSVGSTSGQVWAHCTVGTDYVGDANFLNQCAPIPGVAVCGGCSVKLGSTNNLYWPSSIGANSRAQTLLNGAPYGTADVATASVSCTTEEPPPSCANNAGQLHGPITFTGENVALGCLDGCQIYGSSVATSFSGKTYWAESQWSSAYCSNGQPTAVTNTNVKTMPNAVQGACTEDGTKCVSAEKTNCGYADTGKGMEYRCITSSQLQPGSNPCVTTASGAMFCVENTPAPPAPDQGVPGTLADTDARFILRDPADGAGSGVQHPISYYTSSTVAGSSTNPGDDSGSNDGSGTDTQDNCGSTPCTVKVDETGTPTSFTAPDGPDHDGAVSSISGIAQPHIDTAAGEASSLYPSILGGQSCQTIDYTVSGHSAVIPTAQGCSALHTIRDIFAWLFYLFTAVWIVMRVGKGF